MSSQVPFLDQVDTPAIIPVPPTHRVRENIPESSGPFYFYSPGERIAVHDDHLGFPFFDPGIIQPLTDQEMWALAVYIENPQKQRWTRDPFTGRDMDEERSYRIPASANRLSAILKYGPGVRGFPPGESNHGLVEITAFAERKPNELGISTFNAPFNKRICPVLFDYKQVPESLQKRVGEIGGLEVRRELVLDAREFFASDSFVRQANRELQSLYLRAIEEMLEGFEQYRYFATAYVDGSDKAIKNGDRNRYDDRDYRLMWLLHREPVDTALTRALTANSGGGLSADQLSAILERVAPQQGNTSPEFIASVVAATVILLNQQKPQEQIVLMSDEEPKEPVKDETRAERLQREARERHGKS
jgi:hypothetical protein